MVQELNVLLLVIALACKAVRHVFVLAKPNVAHEGMVDVQVLLVNARGIVGVPKEVLDTTNVRSNQVPIDQHVRIVEEIHVLYVARTSVKVYSAVAPYLVAFRIESAVGNPLVVLVAIGI